MKKICTLIVVLLATIAVGAQNVDFDRWFTGGTLRIDCMRDALRRDSLLVSEACFMLCQALAGKYHWEKLRSARGDNAEKWSDKPEKNEWSHIADSAQYLSLAIFRGATDFSRPGGAASVSDYSYLAGSGSDFGCF